MIRTANNKKKLIGTKKLQYSEYADKLFITLAFNIFYLEKNTSEFSIKISWLMTKGL